jgi:hypothetical protein
MPVAYLFVEFAETEDGAWVFRATSGTPVPGVERAADYCNRLGADGWALVTSELIVTPLPRGCLGALLGAPERFTRTLVLIFTRPMAHA